MDSNATNATTGKIPHQASIGGLASWVGAEVSGEVTSLGGIGSMEGLLSVISPRGKTKSCDTQRAIGRDALLRRLLRPAGRAGHDGGDDLFRCRFVDRPFIWVFWVDDEVDHYNMSAIETDEPPCHPVGSLLRSLQDAHGLRDRALAG